MEQNLADFYWLTCFSDQRYGLDNKKEGVRSEFERDYDRIIFSSAFRRLQNKTQVFPLPKHVFVHNRLTHSLEVASVGRSLGKLIGNHISKVSEVSKNATAKRFYKNQLKNVIAAGALAHDLGNPAFGHSGEEAISKYFKENKDETLQEKFTKEEWADLTNFEGNANALRILTRQYHGRLRGGFRLTYSTLSSILKYPCASVQATGNDIPVHLKKYGYFQTEITVFNEIAKLTNMVPDPNNVGAYFRHPFVYLVEAADDICYNIIDFEDAHRLGILSQEEVIKTFLEIIIHNKDEDINHVKKTCEELSEDSNEQIAYLRAKAINHLILACAAEFIKNIDAFPNGEYVGSLFDNLPGVSPVLKEIKATSYKRIYNYPSVAKIELAGFEIMSTLVEKFIEAALTKKENRIKRHKKILELLPNQHRFEESDSDYEKAMCIIDYIAGMTDLFALELYNNITGIEMPTF